MRNFWFMLCMPGANSRSSLIQFACIGVAPPRLYRVYIYINIKYVIVRLYEGNFGNLYNIHAKNPSQSHSVFSSVLACMCTHWVCVNKKPTMSKLHTPSYHINSLKLSRKFPLQRVGSELSWGLEVNWYPNELNYLPNVTMVARLVRYSLNLVAYNLHYITPPYFIMIKYPMDCWNHRNQL